MTGGMSKGLLQELRAFLLKEEPTLAKNLQRMSENLDACRRTRVEVLDSQRLEREISGVDEAGEAMFSAAVAATMLRAQESARRCEEARSRSEAAAQHAQHAQRSLADARAALALAQRRRQDEEEALAKSQSWASQVAQALVLSSKLT